MMNKYTYSEKQVKTFCENEKTNIVKIRNNEICLFIFDEYYIIVNYIKICTADIKYKNLLLIS